MSIHSFINDIINDDAFLACNNSRQRAVLVLQRLLRSPEAYDYISSELLEGALDQVSMRYREVKLDKDYFKFDFGVIVVIRKDLNEYNILTRAFGSIENIRISDNGIILGQVDNSKLEYPDSDIAFEVYPSLPFSIKGIKQFLAFTFSEYTSDIFKLSFFTLLSQLLKALFPFLTVYVTTTIVNIGSILLTLQIGFLSVCLSFLAIVALFLQSQVIQKLESESDKRAQTAVWDRLMKIDLSYVSPYKPTDLVSRAASISNVRTLLSSQNITSFIALLFSLVYLVEMYSYLPVPTFSVLPLLIFFIMIVVIKARSGGALLKGSLETNADISDLSNTIFSGYSSFITSSSFVHIKSLWLSLIKKSAAFAYRYRQKDNSLDILSTSFMSISFLLSFVSIISFDSDLLDDPSFLASAIGYTSALTIFCSTLSAGTVSIVNSFINVLSYWKRAQPIVFSPIEPGYNESCYPVSLEGGITIEDVSFAYGPDMPVVLNKFSLAINPCSINPLIIESGKGTSTLFRLLLALYPATSGSIYYDSHRLESILVSSLRSQVKLAPQNLNIPIGNIYRLFRGPFSLSDESLTQFVNAFNLGDFIEHLRMGIDTPLANNGIYFPLKQRQLFSLAYACSQAPKILLIDNCLSEVLFQEKVSIFNFLLSKQITVVISDPDSEQLAKTCNVELKATL
jgi:ABC-type bacteriocin/lantibiotic exporter with double-glycine peptidase domain